MISELVHTNDMIVKIPSVFVSVDDDSKLMFESLVQNGFIIMLDKSLYKTPMKVKT